MASTSKHPDHLGIIQLQQASFLYDIFFCFSSKDRENVKPICKKLQSKGLKLYLADERTKNIFGIGIMDKIDNALCNSQHFLIFDTPNTFTPLLLHYLYQVFYTDHHVKNPDSRLLMVYKTSNSHDTSLPKLLSKKPSVSNQEQIISMLDKVVGVDELHINQEEQIYLNELLEQSALTENRGKLDTTKKALKTSLYKMLSIGKIPELIDQILYFSANYPQIFNSVNIIKQSFEENEAKKTAIHLTK
jgi:hypothetical protein